MLLVIADRVVVQVVACVLVGLLHLLLNGYLIVSLKLLLISLR